MSVVLNLSTTESSPRMWGCFRLCTKLIEILSVFPTHVGVFLSSPRIVRIPESLPHACGGVSQYGLIDWRLRGSSPRMWGCFRTAEKIPVQLGVFPTHVGVFPGQGSTGTAGAGLPHACGGVSMKSSSEIVMSQSSPRMWGCFSV